MYFKVLLMATFMAGLANTEQITDFRMCPGEYNFFTNIPWPVSHYAFYGRPVDYVG